MGDCIVAALYTNYGFSGRIFNWFFVGGSCIVDVYLQRSGPHQRPAWQLAGHRDTAAARTSKNRSNSGSYTNWIEKFVSNNCHGSVNKMKCIKIVFRRVYFAMHYV